MNLDSKDGVGGKKRPRGAASGEESGAASGEESGAASGEESVAESVAASVAASKRRRRTTVRTSNNGAAAPSEGSKDTPMVTRLKKNCVSHIDSFLEGIFELVKTLKKVTGETIVDDDPEIKFGPISDKYIHNTDVIGEIQNLLEEFKIPYACKIQAHHRIKSKLDIIAKLNNVFFVFNDAERETALISLVANLNAARKPLHAKLFSTNNFTAIHMRRTARKSRHQQSKA